MGATKAGTSVTLPPLSLVFQVGGPQLADPGDRGAGNDDHDHVDAMMVTIPMTRGGGW
jgi:hypothetical protein